MARKKKVQVEDDDGPGAPDWIVTFSDMISLLVTFFILLLTFSSLEEYDVFKAPENILGSTGTMEPDKGPSMATPPTDDLMAAIDSTRGADSPHSRPPDEIARDIENMGQKKTADRNEIDLSEVNDGLTIHYDRRASFKPGSTEVNENLKNSLVELARVLQHYPYLVVVEGFTDNEFKPTARHASAEALGVARANAAARIMLDNSEMSPKLVQVAGVGARRPVASNDSATSRVRNRRVEIRIVSLSDTRASQIEREKL
jgi:chemotaxis protein MotB